jgi:hypothetical protein
MHRYYRYWEQFWMQVIQHHRNRGMPSGGGGCPQERFYMYRIRDFYRADFFCWRHNLFFVLGNENITRNKIPMTAARILIIDDERIVAEVLRLARIKIGYEPAGSTATGEDAIRLT